MQPADKRILHDAIARNGGIVLSLPSAGILRHHKSRFLDETPEGIWVECPAREAPLVEELIASQRPCGVSFKNGPIKVVYGTPILRRNPEYRINALVDVAAILMRFPDEIKAVQRRSNYRVYVPTDSDLKIRVWRIGPGVPIRDKPMNSQEITAQLRDVSLGGVGVVLTGEDNKPPRIAPEERLRVALSLNDLEMILEAHLRYPTGPLKNPTIRAGLQFKTLEKDIDGRQTLATLTRIIGELTRAELRRMRIGLTASPV